MTSTARTAGQTHLKVVTMKASHPKNASAGRKVASKAHTTHKKSVKPTVKKNSAPAKDPAEPPILRMMSTSKKEAQHYTEALKFALKSASPNSQALQTVHLTLSDVLIFNAKQDEAFKRQWLKGELALLVAFPCNWQTLSLQALNRLLDIDMDEDEDAEDWPEMSVEERFDLIYENSLKVYFPTTPTKSVPKKRPVKATVAKKKRGDQ